MLFETLLCENGEPLHLFYHEQRMRRCGYIGEPIDITPPDTNVYRCKVVYDTFGYSVEFLPYLKSFVKTLKLVVSDDLEYSKKYVDRSALVKIFELRGDADDALIIKDGAVTDTTIANVAFLDDSGIWRTPALPLLRGTTRERLIEKGFLKKRDIIPSELIFFKSIAIMNALRGFEELGNPREVLI